MRLTRSHCTCMSSLIKRPSRSVGRSPETLPRRTTTLSTYAQHYFKLHHTLIRTSCRVCRLCCCSTAVSCLRSADLRSVTAQFTSSYSTLFVSALAPWATTAPGSHMPTAGTGTVCVCAYTYHPELQLLLLLYPSRLNSRIKTMSYIFVQSSFNTIATAGPGPGPGPGPGRC